MKNVEGFTWLIAGPVFVGDDSDANAATLNIEAGVTVFADTTTDDTLLCVTRGSKLEAVGTADAPVVFTPSADGELVRGMWGGLIINGKAHLNKEGGVAEGEGNTGEYGGGANPDNADSSGTLKYVVVEYAGKLITTEDELNGIAFQAVGSGTTVDYVQVHMNQDDGMEFFGGTVNAKHIVLSGIGDDSIDWTSGYTGKIQYAIVHQYGDNADRGIEADNDKNNNDIEPRSEPMISNLTIVGCGADCQEGVGSHGILLRRGTGLKLYNSIVSSAADACVDLDDDGTYTYAQTGATVMHGVHLFGCNNGSFDADEEDTILPAWFEGFTGSTTDVDPQLTGWVPAAGSPALSTWQAPGDAFFEDAGFAGAVGTTDWAAGWTSAE